MLKVKKTFITLEQLSLLYADVEGIVSFTLVPASLREKVTDDKFDMEYIRRNGFTHVQNDPMVQIALLGDGGEKEFFAGNCMNNASSCYEFALIGQEKRTEGGRTEIVTYFDNRKGAKLEHHIVKESGVNTVECFQVLKNEGDADIVVEMIASFQINALSPFTAENDVDEIYLHRLRTNWSAEGKPETFTAAELQLEDSWSSYGIRQARIGQVGSMPCRTHMPFYAVEDRNMRCTWAVSLEAPASWHIDAVHHQTSICLTGGIADFESGHFRKKLAPGEEYRTYSGFLTAVEGGLEEACAALQELYAARLALPPAEEDLPLIYNEYCYSWGNPGMETLKPVIDECARLGVREFVVDVGWWRPDERSWYTFGDWNPSPVLFPEGMGELTSYIRARGMIPGLWFEFEGVSADSTLFGAHADWLLTRDGYPIRHRERSLLDFRKPEVIGYLREKVIKLLKENDFGYVKVDYNEPIGIGCDGAESYGEGLRQQIACVISFFEEIRREIPGIVIEVCSSGGHRLEPKFLSLASMASFSDAHLGLEGAVIAADLHRYMLPRQMQIWAVVEAQDSLSRVYFTLAKGMLGRLCLSGDLSALDGEKMRAVRTAVAFYARLRPVLKNGRTLVNENRGVTSLRRLKGARWLIRFSADGTEAVLWAFSFDRQPVFAVGEPSLAAYRMEDAFVDGAAELEGETLSIRPNDPDSALGAVFYLRRR